MRSYSKKWQPLLKKVEKPQHTFKKSAFRIDGGLIDNHPNKFNYIEVDGDNSGSDGQISYANLKKLQFQPILLGN